MGKQEDKPYRISAEQLFKNMESRQIITTTLGMDIALSGGIVRGCTMALGSGPKLGKTTFSLFVASRTQNLYGAKVFYYNLEGRLTNFVLSQIPDLKMGEDDFIVYNPPPIKSDDGEIIGHRKWPMESVLEHIGQTILNNPGCVIIVDSISNISSEKEISEDIGYADMGAKNKIEASFCRKYLEMVVPNKIIMIFICQIISNPGQYGFPFKMKISNPLKHASDIILFGRTMKKWEPNKSGTIAGHQVNFLVEASALGQPFLEAGLSLRYGKGPDVTKDLVENAINWGIIKKSSSWFSLPFIEKDSKIEYIDLDGISEDIKVIKVQGEPEAIEWFNTHKKEFEFIDISIREKIFGKSKTIEVKEKPKKTKKDKKDNEDTKNETKKLQEASD